MKLEFDLHAWEDIEYWVETDRKLSIRILKLIEETAKHPFDGLGKPEPLSHMLSRCWSRRIDHCHRLVYSVDKNTVKILACRYHYE